MRTSSMILVLLLTAGCAGEEAPDIPADDSAGTAAPAGTGLPTDTAPGVATALASGQATLPRSEIEAGRHDDSWRRFATRAAGDEASTTRTEDDDGATTAGGSDSTPPETWDDIGPGSVTLDAVRLPLHGEAEGPSVLAAQILLDRALYRPGVVDGRWGKNTEKAVYWMQHAEGLEATGRVDEATFRALRELAGDPAPAVVEREVTSRDVEGPFVDIPEDVYEKAELECLCYESVRERLAERFHTTPEVLERLNPGTDLDGVGAGDRLRVPNVTPFTYEDDSDGPGEGRRPDGEVAEIVVSNGGHWVHALDARGRLLYHFPSTLGSDYAPSPGGSYEIDSVHQDPTWHYKPDLLTGVDPSRPDALLPPGPNNAVGVVWMQLSKPHYGIHGTSAPETIGYATSHGCVRLTNWDAELLSHLVEAGVPVRFVDDRSRAADDAS